MVRAGLEGPPAPTFSQPHPGRELRRAGVSTNGARAFPIGNIPVLPVGTRGWGPAWELC